jgi:hypothetical protein
VRRLQTSRVHSLPPFIATSVPKSGTHLIHQILNGIPNIHNDITNIDTKFFVNNPPTNFYEDHYKRLSRLQPNEFGLGHLYYSKKYENMLQYFNLKHIFIYRDPRDVLISLTYFIPTKWGTHPLHQLLKEKTQKERALILINGIEGSFPDFRSYIEPFYGWIGGKNCFSLTFEQLISSQESRKKKMGEIIHYLWEKRTPPIPISKLIELMELNINPGNSRTFRQGKIGAWKQEFDEEIKEAFKKNTGQLLMKTGYEKDLNW